MSASDGARFPAQGVPSEGAALRRARRTPAAGTHSSMAVRLGVSRWSGYAWGVIGLTVAFIAITCWWLTQDHSIPIYDAGDHLETVFLFHDMIRAGDLLGPFNFASPYPPFAVMVGTIAAFVGGVNVAAPIIGENVVFVPLLTLGCYQIGRLLFGARAGFLAALFVLGSPLLIAQLHVFMLDAPEAALVAISVWLLLACEDFSRIRFAALAGLTVGVGMLIKVQFPPFVLGVILVALLRGGWRNPRGLVTFAVVALVVAAPWYLNHLSEFSTFAHVAGPHEGVPIGDTPPTLSIGNFAWYFWNIMNSQFLVPLFTLILGGTVWMAASLIHHRREALGLAPDPIGSTAPAAGAMGHPGSSPEPDHDSPRALSDRGPRPDRGPFGARLEFFAGAVVAWLLITLTPSHDIRYGMPLMSYIAVIATGWILFLPRTGRWIAIAVVVLGVLANTLSTTFGLGGTARVVLTHPRPMGEEAADTATFYTNEGFMVAGPRRDGDVPALLQALHRNGVQTIALGVTQSTLPDFSFEGIVPLARIANLTQVISRSPEFSRLTRVATLIHEPVAAKSPPTCTRLSDGTGVWVVRYDPSARKLAMYCPYRKPQFYDPGIVR